jgi:hypothetical protein
MLPDASGSNGSTFESRRIQLPRKKVIETIAQSFANASRDSIFANKLVIDVNPDDARQHNINLFQIKDYLTQTLHIY